MMGDHADDALDECMAAEELAFDLIGAPMYERYEAGLCDERGFDYFPEARVPRRKPAGPGKCPRCGAETVLKEGKFGEFYGCSRFPVRRQLGVVAPRRESPQQTLRAA